MFFLELSCFLNHPTDVSNLISVCFFFSLPFLNPAWTSGSSQFMYSWSLALNFEHHFASMWNEHNWMVVWSFLGIAFLWVWNENWFFPVLWLLLSFPNLLAYWVQHFHSIIFIKNDRMISICFQGKPLNIIVIQVYAQAVMLKKLKLNGSMKIYRTF